MALAEINALAMAGKFREARDRIAALAAEMPAHDHPYRDPRGVLEAAAIHHEHGTLAWKTARFDEAAAALDRAYRLRVDAVGAEHPLTLHTIERQAALADYQGRSADARRLFAIAIDGLAAALGRDAIEVAIARRNHAAFLRDDDDCPAARRELDAAVPVLERRCGREHPSYAAALKVDALLALGERVEWRALRQAERAIDACRRCHGGHHPFTAAAHLIAATAEARVDRPDHARGHVELAIADLELAYGDHPLTALALWAGGRIDRTLGDRKPAEYRLRRAIAIYQATHGERGLLAAIAHPLWSMLETDRRWAEAAPIAELCAAVMDDHLDRVEWLGAAVADYSRAGLRDVAYDRVTTALATITDPVARTSLEQMRDALTPRPPPSAPPSD